VSADRPALAFDLGASGGRAVVGSLEQDGRLTVAEVHRFENIPVRAAGRLHWDILRLLHEVKLGIRAARRTSGELGSIGVDSWAVDFGLIGRHGELLGNPYHYRDEGHAGAMEEVTALLGRDRIFAWTGIQFLPFNTVYQLYALRKRAPFLLEQAESLLMIPDLLRYFLTGRKATEFTNATTTQLFNPTARQWEKRILQALDLPERLLLDPVEPGTPAGELTADVRDELGVGPVPVIAVGEHDTASAVAAVPAETPDFAYLICGTWSLLGTELAAPVLTDACLRWNYTNEGGVFGTFRLLKNIMGLWLLQECRRTWENQGYSWSYSELVRMAESEPPLRSLVDPDDVRFLAPGDMPERIRRFCAETGQPVPETPGAVVRTVLESLALAYRRTLERTEALAGKRFDRLHMTGGGIHNELLCRMTAAAVGKPVLAGPAEASAIGNLLVQFIARGALRDLREARAVVRASFECRVYEPRQAWADGPDADDWEKAYARFVGLTERGDSAC